MSNVRYPAFGEALLNAQIAWMTDTIKLVLVTAGYVYSASHKVLSDIPSGDRLSTSPALTGKSITNGVAGAAFTSFPTVTGAQAKAFIAFKSTGTESTSTLICYDDTYTTGDGLPIVPNNNTITVQIPAIGGLFTV